MLKQETQLTGSGFLSSIEGFRALAVLSVLLFHLGLESIAGGYLGVDLFFVISGFIITRNILLQQSSGTFSLKAFYIRRFRRLFPALSVTVLVTLLVALPIVPARELALLGKSALFALFSLANINFWLEAGYFDAVAHTKPLLHTWSLSVEEQFYLFWPALLVWIPLARQAPVAALLLLISIASAFTWRQDIADAVFYLLPFRVHQLMVGALVAILSLQLHGKSGALALIVGSAGFLGLATVFADTISPTEGAIGVTIFGFFMLLGRESPVALAMYGQPLLQWIGKRSYALYLVHWPLVVLYLYARSFEPRQLELGLLFVMFFVLAAVLHRTVEQPFRLSSDNKADSNSLALPVTAFTLLASSVLAGTYWQTGGNVLESQNQYRFLIESVGEERTLRELAIRNGRCHLQPIHQFDDFDISGCLSLSTERPNVLIMGSSLAADLYITLSHTYPGIHFLQATAARCPVRVNNRSLRNTYNTCLEFNELRIEELARLEVDAIVLATGSAGGSYIGLRNTLEQLEALNKRVIVFGPRIKFHAAVPLLISQAKDTRDINSVLSERAYLYENEIALVRSHAADFNAAFIDLAAIQCTPICDSIHDGRLLYLDEIHFTTAGAHEIGRRLMEHVDFPSLVGASD